MSFEACWRMNGGMMLCKGCLGISPNVFSPKVTCLVGAQPKSK